MLEIEVKYAVGDFGPIETRLRAWNAPLTEQRDDADSYYNAPHRDFARTDEALRVRRIGAANFATYKGPRIDKLTKTRMEIEIPLADGPEPAEGFERILKALGFHAVAVVRKHRRVYCVTRSGFEVHVCLDEVERVGRYAELEIVAEESLLDSGRAVLIECAAELGLVESERRSYLELLLAAPATPS